VSIWTGKKYTKEKLSGNYIILHVSTCTVFFKGEVYLVVKFEICLGSFMAMLVRKMKLCKLLSL
jgi:hypothetical protein